MLWSTFPSFQDMKMLFSLDRSYSKVPAEDVNKDIDSCPSVSRRWTRLVILAVCCFIAGAVSVEVGEMFKSYLGHQPRTLECECTRAKIWLSNIV